MTGAIHAGRLLIGNIAPDRPNIGKTIKLVINWYPVGSSILEAIAIPNAVKAMPINAMNPKAMRKPGMVTP